jgi:hypothetical protein
MTTGMKPGDHPDFFRLPPPPGASRESRLRLDREGQFWDGDEKIEQPRFRDALNAWISRHPDDGRYLLTNGYDWTYFTVDDAPFFVGAVHDQGGQPYLVLTEGTEQKMRATGLKQGEDGALYTPVEVRGVMFEARFTRTAQAQLAPFLVEMEPATAVGVRIDNHVVVPEPRGKEA